MNSPKRLKKVELFSSPPFSLQEVDLAFSNGNKRTYRYVEKNDTAMIVPVTGDRNVIFVKEYCAAAGDYQLTLPKGRVEDGLDPVATAGKELQEEIGYRAGSLELLGVLSMSPSYYTQRTHVYVANNLEPSKLDGDEPEEVEVKFYPIDRIRGLIKSGELTEARSIAALFMAIPNL